MTRLLPMLLTTVLLASQAHAQAVLTLILPPKPFCPADIPEGDPIRDPHGPCPGTDAFVDLVNGLCDRLGKGQCLGMCKSCRLGRDQQVHVLDTGSTLSGPFAASAQWCGLGGRGRLMANTAVCLLRDLYLPALGNDVDFGKQPGVHVKQGVDVGFGDVEVREHVGFISYERSRRRMNGYRDIDVCVPIFGCVDHLTQRFTATVVASAIDVVPGGTVAALSTDPPITSSFVDVGACADYGVEQQFGVEMRTDDEEYALQLAIKDLFQVDTIIGSVGVTPKFKYATSSKTVRPPFGDPLPPSLPYYDLAVHGVFREKLFDTTSITPLFPAVPFTGWNDQVALGGRDPAFDHPVWSGKDPNQIDPNEDRPDLFTEHKAARTAVEKLPSGLIEAKVRASYTPPLIDLIPDFIKNLPFVDIPDLTVWAEPGIAANLASQFNVYFNEGKIENTSVRLETGTQAFVEGTLDTGIDFSMKFKFGPFSKTIEFHPHTGPILLGRGGTGPVDGPFALATSKRTPPGVKNYTPVTATFSTFQSFSRGAEDGDAFLKRCDEDPPPPPQRVPPAPHIRPTDPAELSRRLEFPCNICVNVPDVRDVCRPNPALVSVGLISADYDCGPQLNTGSCTDSRCVLHEFDPPVPTRIRYLFDGVSQSSLPAAKRWHCNAFAQNGCFDLCTYDPKAEPTRMLTRSALDLPGGEHCRDVQIVTPVKRRCETHSDCDDGNPCTAATCVVEDGVGTCEWTPVDGPCDDKLFCNGADHCEDGFCVGGSTNPCAVGECCREDGDTCAASCGTLHVVQCTAPDGSSCDDESACTTDDVCVAGLCHGTSVCDDGDPCTDDSCNGTGAAPTCNHVRNTLCPAGCGNGVLEEDEECDGDHDAACPHACQGDCSCSREFCRNDADDDGDGLTDCHDPDCAETDDCLPRCGNGLLDPGEQCDRHEDAACPGACSLDCFCRTEDCANSIDDDDDGRIDCEDTACQGQPCGCLPIGRDPGRITFGAPGHDSLKLHGTVTPCQPLDLVGSEVAGVLTNSQGVVAEFTLPSGSLVQRGAHRFTFFDGVARRTRSGLARLRFTGARGTFLLELYGDLSKATDPTMTFQLRVGSVVFVNTGTWKPTQKGWALALPGE